MSNRLTTSGSIANFPDSWNHQTLAEACVSEQWIGLCSLCWSLLHVTCNCMLRATSVWSVLYMYAQYCEHYTQSIVSCVGRPKPPPIYMYVPVLWSILYGSFLFNSDVILILVHSKLPSSGKVVIKHIAGVQCDLREQSMWPTLSYSTWQPHKRLHVIT